eukprot:GGOE01008967.1.p1 GENE.GGOE01008967.1~~GGOE01008967.1.p1  ORF type:complete len:270 (-),score=61.26 GGOE01008967.1:1930-2709(-)
MTAVEQCTPLSPLYTLTLSNKTGPISSSTFSSSKGDSFGPSSSSSQLTMATHSSAGGEYGQSPGGKHRRPIPTLTKELTIIDGLDPMTFSLRSCNFNTRNRKADSEGHGTSPETPSPDPHLLTADASHVGGDAEHCPPDYPSWLVGEPEPEAQPWAEDEDEADYDFVVHMDTRSTSAHFGSSNKCWCKTCSRPRVHHCRLCGMRGCQDCIAFLTVLPSIGCHGPQWTCRGCHVKATGNRIAHRAVRRPRSLQSLLSGLC